MLRTLIIDDEAHNRDTLRKLLEVDCPEVSVTGEATGVAEGIKGIRNLRPDLVFLDINMTDGTGFDLLQSLDKIDFRIIFVSASGRDTIRTLKLSSLEYLTKPFSPEELIAAVKNAERSNPQEIELKLKSRKNGEMAKW
jgi:two-component system, LytTR family, response regulator